VTLVEILTEVRNRLLDSGDWGIGWSATADATAVMDAIDRIAQLEAALTIIAKMGEKHPDPYVEGLWFAGHARQGLAKETKGEQG
jgi:hypothetical protein